MEFAVHPDKVNEFYLLYHNWLKKGRDRVSNIFSTVSSEMEQGEVLNVSITEFYNCGYTIGGVYVPCIYLQARWSYCRWFRSWLLCPLSPECFYSLSLLIVLLLKFPPTYDSVTWPPPHSLSPHSPVKFSDPIPFGSYILFRLAWTALPHAAQWGR